MSADTTPITPARFAAALKDLSLPMMHLKVLEIRNSIAHLQYSNDQLRPFAEGSATAVDAGAAGGGGDAPDQDCVDAIRENEQVIERMAERIALVRLEVEERGHSWNEFQSKEEVEAGVEAGAREQAQAEARAQEGENGVNGTASHSAWTDGTFQTGTIRDGEVHMDGQQGQQQGGSLSDEQLRAALEERIRSMATAEDADEDGGMHL